MLSDWKILTLFQGMEREDGLEGKFWSHIG
jgi:hypothetical protein